MDVRGKKMDFFPAVKAKAAALKNGEGLHIIQTFEPVPLYPVLALMGFEHHTETVSYTHLGAAIASRGSSSILILLTTRLSAYSSPSFSYAGPVSYTHLRKS